MIRKEGFVGYSYEFYVGAAKIHAGSVVVAVANFLIVVSKPTGTVENAWRSSLN